MPTSSHRRPSEPDAFRRFPVSPAGLLVAGLFLVVPAAATPGGEVRRIRHLDVEDGLSHSVVYAVRQDRRGFLWFGTEDGLDRYDGYEVRNFRAGSPSEHSMSSGDVSTLYEDSSGMLWIGTWGGGLNRFDPTSETFRRFVHDPDDPASLAENRIQAILEDTAGHLWIGSYQGLDRLADLELGTFEHVRHDRAGHRVPATGRAATEPAARDRVWSLVEQPAGILWIATDRGVDRFDVGAATFRHFRHRTDDLRSLSSNSTRVLAATADGTLWVGSEGGLDRYDPETGTFERLAETEVDPGGLTADTVNTLGEDRRGNLWIGTLQNGLLCLARDSDPERPGRVTKVTPRDIRHRDAGRPASNDIRSIVEDSSGLLWVATRGRGVDVLELASPAFRILVSGDSTAEPGPSRLSHRVVLSILEDGDDLWVGTEQGLDRFPHDVGATGPESYRPVSGDPASLVQHSVSALHRDRAGRLWVGTFEGLDRLDPESGRFRHLELSCVSENFRCRQIQDIDDGDGGRLWIATRGGLLDYDPEKGVRRHYTHDPGDSQSLSDNLIWDLFLDDFGHLWLGTDTGGLERFDPADPDGRFEHFRHEPADERSLSNNRVTSVTADPSGHLWVATSRGLNRLESTEPASFRRYYDTDGLPSSSVQCLLADPAGSLWISTNAGLSRLQLEGEEAGAATGSIVRGFQHFDLSDGLQGLLFTRHACYRGAGGRMYFGGLNGLNLFDPADIRKPQRDAPVLLTSFRVFNEERRVGRDRDIVLSYRENYFSFEFTSIDFRGAARNRFAYRLDGLDTTWTEAGRRRYAAYTNLAPGDYELRVKASRGGGVWDEAGAASVRLHITPPFWLTGWFRTLVVFLVAGAVVGTYKLRTRAIRERNRHLEEVVRERTAELRELNRKKNEFLGIAAHDLRSPLGGIISYADLLLRFLDEERRPPGGIEGSRRREPDLWRRFLSNMRTTASQMRDLISQLLDVTAIESGKLTLTLVRARYAELLEERSELHVTAAEDKRISLEWDASEADIEVLCDRVRVAEVIDNLVANAIKYTEPGGSVRVRCRVENGEVVTHVEDNGLGLDPDEVDLIFAGKKGSARPTGGESSTGLGLVIVKKIVELHGGRAWAVSRKGEGSTFSFSLPPDLVSQEAVLQETASPLGEGGAT